MEFKNLFEDYREQIKKRISEVLEEKELDYLRRINTPTNAFEVLKNFSTKGKMLRGSLFLLSANSYGVKIDNNLLNIASSLELMHSALLIHDDIMDNDELRRGEKTVFEKYKQHAKEQGIKDYEHYGISMGIVVGDIALFIAEEIVVYSGEQNLKRLLQFYTRELRLVGLGQLLDFSYGAQDIEFEALDIKKMYIDKSARYSFTLPLALGAISAGIDESEVKKVEELGEKMGLIFQLIDDDLGMFGDEVKIGKPVGSDIRENKKTFMRSLLMQEAEGDEKDFLRATFGKNKISVEEINKIRTLIVNLGVRDKIRNMIDKLYEESKEKIDKLSIQEEYGKIYIDLLDYNTRRTF